MFYRSRCIKSWLLVLGFLTTIPPIAGEQVVSDVVQVNINAASMVSEGESVEVAVHVSPGVHNLDTAFLAMLYDASVLEYVSVKAGTLTTGAGITVGTPNSGELQLVLNMPGLEGVSGEGAIIAFTFNVIGTALTFTDIELSNVLLGNSDAQETPSESGAPIRLIVSDGHVVYGDVSNDGHVTAFDASLAMQHHTGTKQLSKAEVVRADVNFDRVVDTGDADLILQAVVGLVELP